jgi:hypothetical protein
VPPKHEDLTDSKEARPVRPMIAHHSLTNQTQFNDQTPKRSRCWASRRRNEPNSPASTSAQLLFEKQITPQDRMHAVGAPTGVRARSFRTLINRTRQTQFSCVSTRQTNPNPPPGLLTKHTQVPGRWATERTQFGSRVVPQIILKKQLRSSQPRGVRGAPSTPWSKPRPDQRVGTSPGRLFSPAALPDFEGTSLPFEPLPKRAPRPPGLEIRKTRLVPPAGTP